ncbi:nucleoside-triphosphatase [Paenibacillus solisilvae]|uniref:Nucleoside-triphosphatase n=1 Tax=Paenibacillus solisilvae TaxID=2486751 RepID=A0ABW0W684_9BACL
MDQIFFLTGQPRMGKTTAIKEIINRIGPDHCGGFYTKEIRDTTNRVGFTCVTLSGKCQEIANVNSTSTARVGRYGVDIDSFEKIALRAVQDSLKLKKVTVIDEVGFMQMLSIPFQRMIHDIVSSARHIILGTVCVDRHPEIDKIKELPGIKLYSLNEENRNSITEAVTADIIKVMKREV